MNDSFLGYYENELAYFREFAEQFGAQYPKIAGRLRINTNTPEDPHVGRLIEAFAFLTARIRLKIDDEFPQICEAMLQALYPHYLAPFPPVMVCRLDHRTPDAIENPNGIELPRGTKIDTDSVQGEPCHFRTTSKVQLWPLRITQVTYALPPFPVPEFGLSNGVRAVVRVSLECSRRR